MIVKNRQGAEASCITHGKEGVMAKMNVFIDQSSSKSEIQRNTLQDGGNEVRCRNLTTQSWSREKLLPFVRGREPIHIMESTAPQIRRGEIDPVLLSFDEAVDLMVASPCLIRGPLIEVDGLNIQGLHDERLQRYLGDTTPTKKQVQRKIRPPQIVQARSTERRQQFFQTMLSHGFA